MIHSRTHFLLNVPILNAHTHAALAYTTQNYLSYLTLMNFHLRFQIFIASFTSSLYFFDFQSLSLSLSLSLLLLLLLSFSHIPPLSLSFSFHPFFVQSIPTSPSPSLIIYPSPSPSSSNILSTTSCQFFLSLSSHTLHLSHISSHDSIS